MTEKKKLPPIKFAELAAALLAMSDRLVPVWLNGGVRRGLEWVCGSLSGGEGSSCSVNLKTGAWADFSTDDRGKDLISLYATIHGLGPGEAAIELARAHGLEDVAGLVKEPGGAPVVRAPRPAPEKPARPDMGPKEEWTPLWPVPEFAPAPPFKHPARSKNDIAHTATYGADGKVFGYVVRFRTSDGGKETLPYTWCKNESDGSMAWKWRTWAEPRPLYFPGGRRVVTVQGDRPEPPTVIVVEGEVKACVLQDLLEAGAPGIYVVVSWPGGSKSWRKAMWEWLAGCTVLLWPDCDAKRVLLTNAQRKEVEAQALQGLGDDVDEAGRQFAVGAALALAAEQQPLKPEDKQPSMAAMLGIGALLRDDHQCKVQLLPIPKPGEKPDGWDARDAIEGEGWDFAKVLEFFGRAGPLPESAVQASAPEGGEKAALSADAPNRAGGGGGGKKPPPDDDTGTGGEDDDAFKAHLDFVCTQIGCKVWQLKVNRKLLIAALRKSPMLVDCVGFNELTEGPETRQAWPWRKAPGPLIDADPLRLGDFLSEHYKLPTAPKNALEEAIDTVADENRYHPVRDWLEGLKHDGKTRIDGWLIYALRLDANALRPQLRRYLELVGRYMLLGLVARVMKPGCKFDYVPILEGKGGKGKSTFIKTIVGETFFSDTHFEIGSGKDSYEQLAGIWGYELSELKQLQRADSEAAKQFLSSQVDRFRGAYGRYVVAHPRQCVIFGSTNKRQYLKDLTGNRRYWPFGVPLAPDLAWLAERREQLFAEALALFKAGAQIYPSPEEEAKYFEPEQRKRLMETAVQARLFNLLTREGSSPHEGKATDWLTCDTKFVTLDGLVAALGSDAAKSTAALEGQIKDWLDAMDWLACRESTGQRRRGYKKPAVWPPKVELDEEDDAPVPDGGAQQVDGEPGAGDPPVEETDGAPF